MPNFVDRKNRLIAQSYYEEKYCLFNTTDTLLIQWKKITDYYMKLTL